MNFEFQVNLIRLTELNSYLGRLLKDGEIKVRSHEDNKIKTRYVFLFDKVIVITAPPKNASEKGELSSLAAL